MTFHTKLKRVLRFDRIDEFIRVRGDEYRQDLTRFHLVKKTISTLLVTCIMVIKLNH